VTIPPQDVTYDVPVSLKLDGKRMCFAYRDREWDGNKEVDRDYVCTYDGRTSLMHFRSGATPYPTATIFKVKQNNDASFIYLRPAMVALRPLDPEMGGAAVQDLRLSGRQGKVGGESCWIVENVRDLANTRNPRESWWVSTTPEHVVRRITIDRGDAPMFRADVSYEKDGQGQYRPSQWSISLYSFAGGPPETLSASVRRFEINERIPIEEFQVELPVGTLVYDRGTKERYLVKPGGKKRLIQPHERGATYEQLQQSESGEAFGERGSKPQR
jgi:hypothetical protein